MKKNPLTIILILLVAIFVCVAILFVKQLNDRQPASQPVTLNSPTPIPTQTATEIALPPIPVNPTLTTQATQAAQATTTATRPEVIVNPAPATQIAEPVVPPSATTQPAPTTVVTVVKPAAAASTITGRPRLVSCGQPQNDGQDYFNAQLEFPSQADAAQYLIQVGVNQQDYSLIDQHYSPNGGQSLQVTVRFASGQTYYARYSYATCTDCGNSFQPFSAVVEMRCTKK